MAGAIGLAVFLCGFAVGAGAMFFWVSWHSVGPLQHEPSLEEVERMHAALERAVQLAQQVESINRESLSLAQGGGLAAGSIEEEVA
jgi:hypothetical protein